MYAQLYVRSAYSLMESTLSIKQIVETAKKLNYDAVCLTDHHVMHGTVEFFQRCIQANIKPLIGLEVDVEINSEIAPFTLIAKNNDGYLALMQWSTYLKTEANFLTLQQLESLSHQCIVIMHTEGGLFEASLLQGEYDQLLVTASQLNQTILDFYVGLSNGESSFWRNHNQQIDNLCQQQSLQTVVLAKVCFAKEDDLDVLRILKAVKDNTLMTDANIIVNGGQYFRTISELQQFYPETALTNTLQLAQNCHVDLNIKKANIPHFENKGLINSKTYLKQLCLAGLKKRRAPHTVEPIYLQRLQYELDVITKMNYEDYFLIVWDFILFARQQGIYVGPGRGSSASSLVAYVLGITHVDPIKYNLLFERFLNPQRISMPDIDIDFPDNRRQEVIDYVVKRYGAKRVAHIVTFGTFGAKQSIRDVGRVMAFSAREIDVISKLIPSLPNMTLQKALNENQRLKQIVENDQRYQRLIRYALKIEGLPRHVSTHAAGIVMSNMDLTATVPLMEIEAGVNATQYSMDYLEQFGLLKMDFLGLRNLTIIDEVVKMIPEPLDILKIPLDDKKTFDLLQRVDTVGIFQLESAGMKQLLKKMVPQTFEDIAATIALFRPGPMENIDTYLKARKNADKIEYLHPDLKEILEETFGVMIYQEQIMQVAQKIAGFSLAKADILRKAMSKKQATELVALKSEFIAGCVTNGYQQALAEEIYALILKFANYGFNKAHSVAYALVAYQMAYLKANYPLQFFTCLLNSVTYSSIKTKEYLDESTICGVRYLPPSVQFSNGHYIIDQQQIRLPLSIIKNVGTVACQAIVGERIKHGLYLDFYDFVARVTNCKVNRKVIESLIYAGALDDFKLSRETMLQALNEALVYTNLITITTVNGDYQLDFSLVSKPEPIKMVDNEHEKLEREKEVLGFYLSSHPLVSVKHKYQYVGDTIAQVKEKQGNVSVLGFIKRIKQHKTKRGDMMAFCVLADEFQEIDLVLMPNVYKQYQNDLAVQAIVYVTGKMDIKGSILVNSLKVLTL